MKFIIIMAFRNLFRQKGRSILIGLGIYVSTIFLIMGYSFNKGMFKNIIKNYVDTNITGHIKVNITEKNSENNIAIVRDRKKIAYIIKTELPDVKEVKESLIIPAYAMVNGKGSRIGLAGIQAVSPDEIHSMEVVEGDLEKFFNSGIENPLILEYKRAKALKVHTGDIVRIRLSTVYGQVQTAQLNLVATVKLTNVQMASFFQGILPFERLKEIAGYRPYEAQSLNIVLKYLKESGDMVHFADRISRILKPAPAYIEGEFSSKTSENNGILTGIQSDRVSVEQYYRQINLLDGEMDLFEKGKGKVHITRSLAERLNLKPGSAMKLSYQTKFDKKNIILNFKVAGIIEDPDIGSSAAAFIDDESFFKTYLNDLPENDIGIKSGRLFNPESPLVTCLAHSWKLAKRTYSANEYNKKQREIRKSSYIGSILDVVTMQEPLESVFIMEPVQEAVIIFIMLIVLLIILVGIVNTTRMNIRERTKEIGTVRAIGMQRKTVVRILIMEMEILCVLTILPGIFSAWGLMELISHIRIPSNDVNLSTILINGRLAFQSPIGLIAANMLLITLMSFLAVYFPVKKAVKKPVTDALGHYE